MKPSRKERKKMKQNANKNSGLMGACGTVNVKKRKKKRHSEHICFHFTPPVYVKMVRCKGIWNDTVPDITISDEAISKILKTRNRPAYAEPAKSRLYRDENGAYVCSECGSRFSEDQWNRMNEVVELLNEGGEDEIFLKSLYDGSFYSYFGEEDENVMLKNLYHGICPVKYHRTTRGVIVAEAIAEEMKIPDKIVTVEFFS